MTSIQETFTKIVDAAAITTMKIPAEVIKILGIVTITGIIGGIEAAQDRETGTDNNSAEEDLDPEIETETIIDGEIMIEDTAEIRKIIETDFQEFPAILVISHNRRRVQTHQNKIGKTQETGNSNP